MRSLRVKSEQKKISMKKLFFLLLIVLQFSFGTLTNTAVFGTGILSGVAIHEFGHATAFWLQGGSVSEFYVGPTKNPLSWGYVKGNFDENDPYLKEEMQWTLIGGFVAQSIATEIVIQNKSLHDNDFALGIMSLGIYVNMVAVIKYWATDQSVVDLDYYRAYGGNVLIPSIIMTIYSLYAIDRIVNQTDIPVRFADFIFKF